MDKQNDRVFGGVPLNENRKEYWIKTKSNINMDCRSFFLSAKDLEIAWRDDPRYWRWSEITEETSGEVFDVAELIEVFWLDVSGKFDTTKLPVAGITYEVVFLINLEERGSHSDLDEQAFGLIKKRKKEKDVRNIPVNVKLILPDGIIRERKANLTRKPGGEWIEIPAGEFVTSPLRTGEIKFSIYDHVGGWKRGLIVKGVTIRPIIRPM